VGADVLARFDPASPAALQARLDAWRDESNHERPHGAIGHFPPSSRYQLSLRRFPDTLPPVASEPAARLLRVSGQGFIVIDRQRDYLSEVIPSEEVEVRPLAANRVAVWSGPIRLTELPLGEPTTDRAV